MEKPPAWIEGLSEADQRTLRDLLRRATDAALSRDRRKRVELTSRCASEPAPTAPRWPLNRPVAVWGRLRVEGLESSARERAAAGRRQPRQPLGPGDGRRRGDQAPPDPGAGQIDALGRAAASGRSSTGWARSRSSAAAATRRRWRGRSRRCGPAPASASSPKAPARAARCCGRAAASAASPSRFPRRTSAWSRSRAPRDLTGFPRRPRIRIRFFEPGRRPAPARRGPGRALGSAPGRAPRAGAALDLLPQALLSQAQTAADPSRRAAAALQGVPLAPKDVESLPLASPGFLSAT